MFIKSLMENTSSGNFISRHGISFYIETTNHKILFDVGPNGLFIKNAKAMGIDLTKIDTVIISHGHNDHGGGLKSFLEINKTAKIFIQKTAFEKHYVKVGLLYINIGLQNKIKNNPQIVFVDNYLDIDDELCLFTAHGDILPSPVNSCLKSSDKQPDSFNHEQSLLIKDKVNVLFTGCSHSGIFNVINNSPIKPSYIIGGFHLYNPVNKKYASKEFLEQFKTKLNEYNNEFYTCHCTGKLAFDYLAKDNPKIHYISCGDELYL